MSKGPSVFLPSRTNSGASDTNNLRATNVKWSELEICLLFVSRKTWRIRKCHRWLLIPVSLSVKQNKSSPSAASLRRWLQNMFNTFRSSNVCHCACEHVEFILKVRYRRSCHLLAQPYIMVDTECRLQRWQHYLEEIVFRWSIVTYNIKTLVYIPAQGTFWRCSVLVSRWSITPNALSTYSHGHFHLQEVVADHGEKRL